MKLTPWYPGHVKPVRVGVYERDYGDDDQTPSYCYFDKVWSSYGGSVEEAESYKDYVSSEQCYPWRGIAKEPK